MDGIRLAFRVMQITKKIPYYTTFNTMGGYILQKVTFGASYQHINIEGNAA